MPRVIRATHTCLVPFNIILGALMALCCWTTLSRGMYWEFLKSAPFILAIYGAVYLLFMSHRIVLTEEKVSLTSFLNPPQQIKISKIVESRVVGGFGGAKSLNIYSKRFEGWEEPALSIPFTPFKKEDIEWLLGLPELRLNDETF